MVEVADWKASTYLRHTAQGPTPVFTRVEDDAELVDEILNSGLLVLYPPVDNT